MHRSDEQLVSAYLERGDEQAFRVLVERHQERIYGYLLGMVRDPGVANDLFQDTFLRVIDALQRRRGSYEGRDRFPAWVLRIARNAALDHFRRRKKWIDLDTVQTDDESAFESIPDDDANVEEIVEIREQNEWLEACIHQLPAEQREVLMLRHEGELTFREIAEVTDCSINTALGRMRYALINLRRIMAKSRQGALARAD